MLIRLTDADLNRAQAMRHDWGGGFALTTAPDAQGRHVPLLLDVPADNAEDGAYLAGRIRERLDSVSTLDEAADFSALPRGVEVLDESADDEERLGDENDIIVQAELPARRIEVKRFDDANARQITRLMMRMDRQDSSAPIVLEISSIGGDVYAAWSIINVANVIGAPVYTLCRDKAMSSGQLVLTLAAPKGNRIVGPNCEVMVHEPNAGMRGSAQDLENQIGRLKKNYVDWMYARLGEATNKSAEYWRNQIRETNEQDKFYTPEESIELGLADMVLDKETYEKYIKPAGDAANDPIEPRPFFIFFNHDEKKASFAPVEP